MSLFFKSKNNQSKYFIYFLVFKDYLNENDENNENKITIKILITNTLILHDLNYIINNYETIIKNELEYKVFKHYNYIFNFDEKIPKYPYDLFLINRILLYSFIYLFNDDKNLNQVLYKEKINIISNINYLKRIKDWSENWKKNRYSIEKYQNTSTDSSINFGTSSNKDNSSESIFSIHYLSQYYFNINNESKDINNNEYLFKCVPMSFSEKSLFERISERPNTDLIEKCYNYFIEDKMIRFV
jgi:hypothetical protein